MKDYWNKLSFIEKVKLIFFGVVGLLILIFALLNWKVYNLNLVFGKIEVPVTILILVSMFGGYAYARIYGALKSRKREKEISYLKGELAATREKLRKEPLELKKKPDDNKEEENA
jgi:uncharacterized integral membrane protein